MERLRPDDHFLVLLEGDETPMHIGSLMVLDTDGRTPDEALHTLRDHLRALLPGTPLLRRLRRAPLGFDSDVWVGIEPSYLDAHLDDHIVVHHADRSLSRRDLHAFVEEQVMVRLDLERPPFLFHLLGPIEGGQIAAYLQVHHCVSDGVGFQTVLGLLSDDPPDVDVPALSPSALPDRHTWLRESLKRFRSQGEDIAAHKAVRRTAIEALRDPELARVPTPTISWSGPTSPDHAFTTVTLAFAELHATARRLDATVNDLFLAIAGTAVRAHLLAAGDLGEEPLTVNAARSYRLPEHGAFGNRIVALNPHIATHSDDPLERLRSIQESMAVERRRTGYDEALLNAPETPFGPTVRRRRFAERRSSGGTIIPGNITVSNIPGPAGSRSYAGMLQRSNHPTPLLGTGRALNFTARRNGESFDVGVMADPEKIPDVEVIADRFVAAYDMYCSIEELWRDNGHNSKAERTGKRVS